MLSAGLGDLYAGEVFFSDHCFLCYRSLFFLLLWSGRAAIIQLQSNPLCLSSFLPPPTLQREEALDLCALFSATASTLQGFTMCGVVKETAPTAQCKDDKCLGVGDFLTNYYPCGNASVLLDTDHSFYDALGGRTLTQQMCKLNWSTILNPFSMWKYMGSMKARGIEKGVVASNLKGEGLKQGGVVIFDKAGKVRYAYLEVTGEEIPKDDILKVIKEIRDEGGVS